MILEACGGKSSSSTSAAATGGGGSAAAGIFGSGAKYKFTLVNHVTTNPFFTPTQAGAADACSLLGCSYQWTGSQTSNVSEMVNAMFIATPGALNIQPRIDGALATLKTHSGITTHVVATGADVPGELTKIDAYSVGHPNTKGYFAVDAGSTQSLAQTIQKHGLRSKGVKGGGYDLTPVTEQLLSSGQIDFTIDQQPYLQGFFPILGLYMYQATQRLTGVADINTGLKFLDKSTIQPYVSTKSRYEGTGTARGVQKS